MRLCKMVRFCAFCVFLCFSSCQNGLQNKHKFAQNCAEMCETSLLLVALIRTIHHDYGGSKLHPTEKDASASETVGLSQNDNYHHNHRLATMTTTITDNDNGDQDDNEGEDITRHPLQSHLRTDNPESPIQFHMVAEHSRPADHHQPQEGAMTIDPSSPTSSSLGYSTSQYSTFLFNIWII